MSKANDINWHWRHFDTFTAREWHEVLRLRAEVFVVEQDCPYVDPDHKDGSSWHLCGHADGKLIATLRVVAPGVSYVEPSIGRVVTDINWRGEGLGHILMQHGLAFCRAEFGGGVRISAQAHLEGLYQSHGFRTVRGPYDEDGIPHLEMLLTF
ncbi:GNAT family N-acetyltransferase [Luminiphilus syltensis]|uniref:GNAT family N-acetyltransferase n=1 Tax=Luminiphilus syltensis TaxID=1341119 RepID=UPI0003185BD0|nr:GNAT family N-acetyltransferase [Luminiphilus syltensis]